MKKLFLAAALMLAGTFVKAQKVANGLDCSILIERYCIPTGQCGDLVTATVPTFSTAIEPEGVVNLTYNTDCYLRIKIPGCMDYWFQWFGSGSCATITSSTGFYCTDCGSAGKTSNQILIQVDAITGDIDILEI